MQSYLYIHKERIRAIYSQFTNGIRTKTSTENSSSVEGSATGSIFSFFKSSVKGSKGGKTIVESVDTPANMLVELVKAGSESGFTKKLIDPGDWDKIEQGDLVVFRGKMEFDSYGKSKIELWNSFNYDTGEWNERHDLRFTGTIAGKNSEIAFSSGHVTGPSQITVLCHSDFDQLEGLAVVIGSPNKLPVMFQPLAFGNGFLKDIG